MFLFSGEFKLREGFKFLGLMDRRGTHAREKREEPGKPDVVGNNLLHPTTCCTLLKILHASPSNFTINCVFGKNQPFLASLLAPTHTLDAFIFLCLFSPSINISHWYNAQITWSWKLAKWQLFIATQSVVQ